MVRTFVNPRPAIDHYLTPFRHLGQATHDGVALLCEVLAMAPPGLSAWRLDQFDERLACVRRRAFGRRSWLLSWHREPDGRWRARLSAPDLERTVERTARTRSCAILRSARAMVRIQAFRARFSKRP